jgi:hypothetical protein
MTENDSRMVSYFTANPGKSVRDMYESLSPADFSSASALRVFIKGAHARASKLFDLGMLVRVESKDESGQTVYVYSVADVKLSAMPRTFQTAGYKARLLAAEEQWEKERDELEEARDLGIILQERRKEERDAALAECARLREENAKLWALLNTATNPSN